MIFYIILAFSAFIMAFVIRHYRNVFYKLAKSSVALVDVLLAELSEDEKIDQVQLKSKTSFYALLKMLGFFVLAFLIGVVPVLIYGIVTKTSPADFDFNSWKAILAISAGATLAFVIPVHKKQAGSYTELSQLLHHMALDNYNVANKLFQRETKKMQKRGVETRTDFVIVSGLARAGTTSLMNDLSKVSDFVSLNYANMPFVMSPNLWKKFYNPKPGKLKERSHKDGIMIGLNSNEALEEYFFKVKMNDSFIASSYLTTHQFSEKDYNDYLCYQANIRGKGNKIYLAKNNNFILRYQAIRNYNNDFLMVILFRDPLSHAASLMEKHTEYCALQKEDPFVLDYMNWLGHHEFGLNQKPFTFDKPLNFSETDKNSLHFWLQSWVNYYGYVLGIDHTNTLLVNYDNYCSNPTTVISTILSKTLASQELPALKPFTNQRRNPEIENEILEQAMVIYNQLCERSLRFLPETP